MSDSTLGQLSWPTQGCPHIFKRLPPSCCCPTEHRRPGENVREVLPAALHRGQQQFPGQLVLGHLWNQGNQGAGSALPGLQVLLGRGDAGRNDVRLGGHELQRLDAQNPPDQVGRNGDRGRLKTRAQTHSWTLSLCCHQNRSPPQLMLSKVFTARTGGSAYGSLNT